MQSVKPAPELEALRISIDDLDRRILELVAERVRVVLAVGLVILFATNNLTIWWLYIAVFVDGRSAVHWPAGHAR